MGGKCEYVSKPNLSLLERREVKAGLQAVVECHKRGGLDGLSITEFLENPTRLKLKDADPLFKWRRKINRAYGRQVGLDTMIVLLVSSAERWKISLPK